MAITKTINEITITRVFDAPRELVWKAWTEPGLYFQTVEDRDAMLKEGMEEGVFETMDVSRNSWRKFALSGKQREQVERGPVK